MVTPARRLLSMFPAALKAEMGRGSSMDWRARSWIPSQFRCAWLLMRPGMSVPPVSSTGADPALSSVRGPTAAISPSLISTKPSSMTSSAAAPPDMVRTRPVSTTCGVGRSNIGLVILS